MYLVMTDKNLPFASSKLFQGIFLFEKPVRHANIETFVSYY